MNKSIIFITLAVIFLIVAVDGLQIEAHRNVAHQHDHDSSEETNNGQQREGGSTQITQRPGENGNEPSKEALYKLFYVLSRN